jgi:hypothetical protein
MDMEYTAFIGLNDRESYQQEIATEEARRIVISAFGCCTVQDCTGGYVHQNGVQTQENSFKVTIFADSSEEPRIVEACQKIKKALNQEAIYLDSRLATSRQI